jgi:hypothetical protein
MTSKQAAQHSGEPDEAAGQATGQAATVPAQVFISYAHDDQAHQERVRSFWLFLRKSGIDARLDLTAADQRQD